VRGSHAAARELRTFVDLPPRYAAWAQSAGLPRLPGSAAPLAPGALPATRVRVTSPSNGLTLLRDPESPPAMSTLALSAVVDPPAPEVVWYVDGRPFQVAGYPYATRWPLEPGEHVFLARVPVGSASSPAIRVVVQ
jgi:penicillin-binding protein 1C